MNELVIHTGDIKNQLREIFTQHAGPFSDVYNRLFIFATSGKLIRGSILIAVSKVYDNKYSYAAIQAASALEILQSSLLIHDDIMDNDLLRRGMKTLHKQYEEIGQKNNRANLSHFGESMAMCVGDVGFFLAFKVLTEMETGMKNCLRCIDIVSKELQFVAAAQMNDVIFGTLEKLPTPHQILDLYRYKTARYTFSIPFMLGALLGGQSKKTMQQLSKLGEHIGILFQIRDDYLDIFGDEKNIGKPIGSDLREKKKTLFLVTLLSRCNTTQKAQLKDMLRKNPITKNDINHYKVLLNTTKTTDILEEKIKLIEKEAESLINELNLEKHHSFFVNLLNYITTRTS